MCSFFLKLFVVYAGRTEEYLFAKILLFLLLLLLLLLLLVFVVICVHA